MKEDAVSSTASLGAAEAITICVKIRFALMNLQAKVKALDLSGQGESPEVGNHRREQRRIIDIGLRQHGPGGASAGRGPGLRNTAFGC